MIITRALNAVILLSGNGSTFQNLYDVARMGALAMQCRAVVSSRRDAFGLVRAEKVGVPTHVVQSKKFKDPASHSAEVFRVIEQYKPDLVVCCGWMTFLVLPKAYEGRVINVHPSLLPKFGGQGMYGIHVHRAVLAAGEVETGCTVHFVDGEYDHGRVIVQKKVWVDAAVDTPEMLQARVQVLEREAYPEAINMLAGNKVAWAGVREE